MNKRVCMVHPKEWWSARPFDATAQRLLEKDGCRVCSWPRWALTVCVEWLREWWIVVKTEGRQAKP